MSQKLTTAIIADDESALSEFLQRLLNKLWPELKIIALANNGLEAKTFIEQYRPDIAFLDIKMPGLTGIQVASSVQGACHIVFVTAYDEFALQAFEAEAVDYLLKPVQEERLQKAIEKLQLKIQQPPMNLHSILHQLEIPQGTQKNTLKWVRASQGDEIQVISIDDILYFQSGDKYTTVVTENNKLLIRIPLKELESQLDDDVFWRVHRGILVRVSGVEKCIREDGKMLLAMANGDHLAVSRGYWGLFRGD